MEFKKFAKISVTALFLSIIFLFAFFIRNQPKKSENFNGDFSKINNFIFDFDGTICDSFEAVMNQFNFLSDEFGYKPFSKSEISGMKNLTMQELLTSFGISKLKLPFIIKKIRKQLNKEIKTLKPFDGVRKALLSLKNRNNKLFILTSNSEENVKIFLKENKIEVFDAVFSGSSLFGKAFHINKLLDEYNIDKTTAVYVGDETRDIEASKEAGIPIISVAWGYNTKKLLQSFNPEFLIDSPSEITNIK